jgi:hypothetical protein
MKGEGCTMLSQYRYLVMVTMWKSAVSFNVDLDHFEECKHRGSRKDFRIEDVTFLKVETRNKILYWFLNCKDVPLMSCRLTRLCHFL